MLVAFASMYTSTLITTFSKTEVNCRVFHYKNTKEFNFVMKCINNNVTGSDNILQVISKDLKFGSKLQLKLNQSM